MVAACSPGTPTRPEDVARRDALLASARAAAPGAPVDLVAATGGDWERLVVFGPYSYNDRARETLGFEFDIERVSPWTNTEGGSVVVLVAGAEPVSWFTVRSDAVSLSCLNFQTIAASSSTLTLVEDATGYRSLVDPDLPECGYILTSGREAGPLTASTDRVWP